MYIVLISISPGGIPARSHRGERLLLFIGIIDILQSYRLKKKLEHTFKSIIHDGVSDLHLPFGKAKDNCMFLFFYLQDTVSVCRPSFYAQRFQDFMAKTVFKKIPSRKFNTVPPHSWQMPLLTTTRKVDSDCLRKFIFEKQRMFWNMYVYIMINSESQDLRVRTFSIYIYIYIYISIYM